MNVPTMSVGRSYNPRRGNHPIWPQSTDLSTLEMKSHASTASVRMIVMVTANVISAATRNTHRIARSLRRRPVAVRSTMAPVPTGGAANAIRSSSSVGH